MAKIREPKDMPPLDKHQWQNLVLQVDTATEERESLMDKVKKAEAAKLAVHKELEDERKARADADAAATEAKDRAGDLESRVADLKARVLRMDGHPDVIAMRKKAKVETARRAKEEYERALAEVEAEGVAA